MSILGFSCTVLVTWEGMLMYVSKLACMVIVPTTKTDQNTVSQHRASSSAAPSPPIFDIISNNKKQWWPCWSFLGIHHRMGWHLVNIHSPVRIGFYVSNTRNDIEFPTVDLPATGRQRRLDNTSKSFLLKSD